MQAKSVFGIVFSNDKKSILMIKRRDVPLWVLPGGGVEDDESPETACIREIKEETHLSISITRTVGLYTSGWFIKPTMLYECMAVSEHIVPESSEVREAKFFNLKKLPYEIPPPFDEFINDTIAHKNYFERAITSITIPKMLWYLIAHPILSLRFLLSRINCHINTTNW